MCGMSASFPFIKGALLNIAALNNVFRYVGCCSGFLIPLRVSQLRQWKYFETILTNILIPVCMLHRKLIFLHVGDFLVRSDFIYIVIRRICCYDVFRFNREAVCSILFPYRLINSRFPFIIQSYSIKFLDEISFIRLCIE